MTRDEVLREREKCRDEARQMVEGGATCTLDGKPARIAGFGLDFGRVFDVADPVRSAEWSWPAIVNNLKNGGKFTTK